MKLSSGKKSKQRTHNMRKHTTNPDDPIHPDAAMEFNEGLTKREYFAGIAMNALISTESLVNPTYSEDHLAKLSVTKADALIKELNKGA